MEDSKSDKKSNFFDLFDNPMVENAKKNMSKEYIEKLKQLGEEFYSNLDFEKSVIINKNFPPEMSDAVLYISEGLKSGIHPNDLELDETRLLIEAYGDKWFEKFGYNEDDIKHKHETGINGR